MWLMCNSEIIFEMNKVGFTVIQSPPHKGDSDKWELCFYGDRSLGTNLHACYFYLLNGTALRIIIMGTFFSEGLLLYSFQQSKAISTQ